MLYQSQGRLNVTTFENESDTRNRAVTLVLTDDVCGYLTLSLLKSVRFNLGEEQEGGEKNKGGGDRGEGDEDTRSHTCS